jgi:hypothetical protein
MIRSGLLGTLLALAVSVTANASVYNFTVDSSAYDVSGQFSTNGTQITAISGNVSKDLNATIIGVDTSDPGGFSGDNIFSPSAPYVTNNGILFDAGAYIFNIYSVPVGNGFDYYISSSQFGIDSNDPLYDPGSLITAGSITAAIPEASTWVMIVLGFLGLGLMSCHRRNNQALSAI